jgi:hypothetical protein
MLAVSPAVSPRVLAATAGISGSAATAHAANEISNFLFMELSRIERNDRTRSGHMAEQSVVKSVLSESDRPVRPPARLRQVRWHEDERAEYV